LLDDGKIQYKAHTIDFEDVEPLIENIIFNQELCNIARRGRPRKIFNLATTEQTKIPRNPSM